MLRNAHEGQWEGFSSYDRSVEVLKTHIPKLVSLVDDSAPSPIDSDAWKTLIEKHEDFRVVGPLLMATLYGPTGGGKSAIFRLLTGLKVPSGNKVRPTSYASTAAASKEVAQEAEKLRRIFRDRPVECIGPSELEKVRDKSNSGKIFVVPMEQNGQGLPMLLADVPDFNSIEEQNWAECEYILRHAHVVVFVVYQEAYADKKVIEELIRCYRLAARLVYVLTKVDDAEQAREIWKDVLQKLSREEFSVPPREDGPCISEFLRRSGGYYSVRYRSEPSIPLGIEELDRFIQPMEDCYPPFSSVLQGFEAKRLVLQGLLLPVASVVRDCRKFFDGLKEKIGKLTYKLDVAQKPLANAAERIAGAEYPIGKFVEIFAKEVLQHESLISRMVRWISGGLKRVPYLSRVKDWLASWVSEPPPDQLRHREELEKENLQRELEDPKENKGLFRTWRSMFPQQAVSDGFLSQERLAWKREELGKVPIPAPATQWEEYARQEIRRWLQERPWYASGSYSIFLNLAEIAGIGVLMAGLCSTGGMFGTIGLMAAAGAGSLVARQLLQWAEKHGLKNLILQVDELWRRQRQEELYRHLYDHLFCPVFQPWIEQLNQLESPEVRKACQECQEACAQLERLYQTVHREGGF